jgi:hypothetical protein
VSAIAAFFLIRHVHHQHEVAELPGEVALAEAA